MQDSAVHTTVDMVGRNVSLPRRPERIISLVPSQTELLADLGLGARVVGITKFCVHPEEWFRSKTRVGGTKNVHPDRIEALNPDLILCNKEENTAAIVDDLSKRYPTWVSDIVVLEDALKMISELGALCQVRGASEPMVHSIRERFEQLRQSVAHLESPKKVLYLIWKNPFMAAGNQTFIGDMIRRAGWINAVDDPSARYPELSEEDIRAIRPDIVLLSSEPFPFKDADVQAIKSLVPTAQVQRADGEAFSWYGSRLLTVPAYLGQLRRSLD